MGQNAGYHPERSAKAGSISKQLPKKNPRNILAWKNEEWRSTEAVQVPFHCRRTQEETIQMARACTKDDQRTPAKSCPEVDPSWKEKTWSTPNHLEKNSTSELLGYSLGQAQHLAKDKVKWRKLVAALCPTRDEEDRWGEVYCPITLS